MSEATTGKYKKKGHLTVVDELGNEYVLLPATTVDMVEGATPLSSEGLKKLIESGPIVLVEGKDYGVEFPQNPVKGQAFLIKV